MGKLRAPSEAAVGYRDPGDWFRAVNWLQVAHRRDNVDESCARVANFLDAWEAANDGPPWVMDGSERLSSWATYCGGVREVFVRVGVAGEQLLPDCAADWYAPIDYREL